MEVMPLHRDMPTAMHRHWTSVPKTRRSSMIFPGTPARRMYMSPSDPESPPIPDELKPARNVIDLSKIYYGQDGRTTVSFHIQGLKIEL